VKTVDLKELGSRCGVSDPCSIGKTGKLPRGCHELGADLEGIEAW